MAKPKDTKPEIVKRIRDLYSKGSYTQKQLADTFGLSQSTVCKIVNNEIHTRTPLNITGKAEIKVGFKHGN